MNEKKELKPRKCDACGNIFSMTSKEIKSHADKCWQLRRRAPKSILDTKTST